MTQSDQVVLLVGHGGVPKDMPRTLVREMKQLYRQANESGDAGAAEKARALEEKIRSHPRTDENDPYRAGILRLAASLQRQLPNWLVTVAYNEFCAPTIEQAIDAAVEAGATQISVMTTMITPGGSHSEIDIPEALGRARAKHPDQRIEFMWPLDLDHLAKMYAAHLAP